MTRLLYKLTGEVSFQFKYCLLNQANECEMCGPLSVTLIDIHMVWMETAVVVPKRPIFYKWLVDDTHNCCLKNTVDKNKYFVNSVLPAFTKAQANEDVAIIILPWFYEVKKKVALVERPYCLNFDAFADDTCDVKIKWLTKKIKTLFKVTLCTKPVKFIKVLAHVMIVILGNC